jgi:hypothetical protein
MDLADAIREFQLVPPIDPGLAEGRDLATRHDTLAGLRVALVDNKKGNADLLLTGIADRLRDDHGIDGATLFTKPIFSRPAPAELLERARTFDIALAAIGD